MTEYTTQSICDHITAFLDERKVNDIVVIDLKDKSSISDAMIIASGTSLRHIQSTGTLLKEELHRMEVRPIYVEGGSQSDWVLIDAGDVIVHLFRPEVREFYSLEKMWGVELADFSRKASSEES